ncbi:MAG: nucleotidyltransferase family protein [Actinomycetes bacterium]
MSGTSALAGAIAAHGLPGAPALPTVPLDDREWPALLRLVTTERLVPVASYAADAGALAVTDAQREDLLAAHERAMSLVLVLERRLLEAYGALRDAGVEVRVLKGPAVGRLDHPDPSWRAFGDVDLLVRGESFDAAGRVLADRGASRRFPEARPGFDARFGKAVTYVGPDGLQIDLHRTFATGVYGFAVDLDALFADAAAISIGGTRLETLNREHRFLHACFHAALGDEEPRLVALRDVAQFVLATDLDLDAARHEAEAWGAGAVVARAVGLAWARLGLGPHPAAAWAAGRVATRRESRALAAHTGRDRSYASQVAAGVSAVPGITGKLAYVRALLLPDRRYLAGRDASYGARLRRAWAARRVVRGGAA